MRVRACARLTPQKQSKAEKADNDDRKRLLDAVPPLTNSQSNDWTTHSGLLLSSSIGVFLYGVRVARLRLFQLQQSFCTELGLPLLAICAPARIRTAICAPARINGRTLPPETSRLPATLITIFTGFSCFQRSSLGMGYILQTTTKNKQQHSHKQCNKLLAEQGALPNMNNNSMHHILLH